MGPAHRTTYSLKLFWALCASCVCLSLHRAEAGTNYVDGMLEALREYIPVPGINTNVVLPCMPEEQSNANPTDFLRHAAEVPEEWGSVCGIQRDAEGNLKILTGQPCSTLLRNHTGFPRAPLTTIQMPTVFIISALLGTIPPLLIALACGLSLRSMRRILTPTQSEHGLYLLGRACAITSIPLWLCSTSEAANWLNKFITSYLVRPTCSWEARVYDWQTKKLESRIIFYTQGQPNLYFLGNPNTIEVHANNQTQTFSRPTAQAKFQQMQRAPTDDISRAMRSVEQSGRNIGLSHIDCWLLNPIKRLSQRSIGHKIEDLEQLDNHKKIILNHILNTHIVHQYRPDFSGEQHDSWLQATELNECVIFHKNTQNELILRKCVRNTITGLWEIAQKVFLPSNITPEKIYCPCKTADSRSFLFNIARTSFSDNSFALHRQVVLDLPPATKQTTPITNSEITSNKDIITLEDCVTNQSACSLSRSLHATSWWDTTKRRKYQQMIDLLRFCYPQIDAEQRAQHAAQQLKRKKAWWAAGTGAALGALGIGAWLYSKYAAK